MDTLETPVPVVDLDRLEANLDRMAVYASAHGLALRPHVKTHKSPRVATLQMDRGAAGLTCATPRELEVMSGVASSLLLAYPPVGSARLHRFLALPDSVELRVSLDSVEAVDALATAAAEVGRDVRVLVEADLGMRRVGVGTPDQVVELANCIANTGTLRFEGVAFYPGHIRSAAPDQDHALRALGETLTEILRAIDRVGLSAKTVSGGSTPTAWRSHEIPGVTEIRPGTYVYNDRATVASGFCTRLDCALTVLATVVSTAVKGQAVVDAGTKALGREPRGGGEDWGYGELLDRPEVTVKAMSEEHGTLDLSRTSWRPRVGERVRIIPNHVCIVTHLFDEVAGVREDRVVETWRVEARGRGTQEVRGER
ncbi:MAG TPA: alanine racemase [Gemmatimonadales bacterium]|nr:alanine racemase [Gemmatimonadales bacterium]